MIADTADRPHFCGWLAAPRRVGLLPPEASKRWWKAPLLERAVDSPEGQPRSLAYRELAEALGIEWRPAMVAPTAHTPDGAWRELVGFDATAERFAVLHLAPRFRYKRWNTPGWHALIAWLRSQGLRVAITGGPGADERAYAREVLAGVKEPVTDATGRLRFAQTADLLRRAAVFVGPDTATTHLAAACGTPTVALFGPTDPRLWGPIPAWRSRSAIRKGRGAAAARQRRTAAGAVTALRAVPGRRMREASPEPQRLPRPHERRTRRRGRARGAQPKRRRAALLNPSQRRPQDGTGSGSTAPFSPGGSGSPRRK